MSVVLGLRDRGQLAAVAVERLHDAGAGDQGPSPGLRACLLVYREAAIESSDTPFVQTVDAEDDDTFEFDDGRLDAMGAKTAEAFNAAVRQCLDRDRDRLTRKRPGC